MISKTAPDKLVTDMDLKANLIADGFDVDYVEFHEDYSAKKPNIKTYRDRKTGEFIAKVCVSSRYEDGHRVDRTWRTTETGWAYGGRNAYTLVANLATGRTIVRRKEDHREWTPVVRIGGVVKRFKSTRILQMETASSKLRSCVLEFQYDGFVRRLYLSHGKYEEWFEFSENPAADIEIESSFENAPDGWDVTQVAEDANCQPIKEFVPGPTKKLSKETLANIQFPLRIDDSTNFTSGYAPTITGNSQGATTGTLDNYSVPPFLSGYSTYSEDDFYTRWVLRFPTGGLDDGAVISGGSVHFYNHGSSEAFSSGGRYKTLYLFTDTSISAASFNNYGAAASSSTLISGSPAGWRSITLNSTGYGDIDPSETYCYFMMRIDGAEEDRYDYYRSVPYSGTTYDPYLTVTYTVPATFIPRAMLFT